MSQPHSSHVTSFPRCPTDDNELQHHTQSAFYSIDEEVESEPEPEPEPELIELGIAETPTLYHPPSDGDHQPSAVEIGSLPGICLIDTSKSTDEWMTLSNEKNMARWFAYPSIVSWSDNEPESPITLHTDPQSFYSDVTPQGGTEPHKMFDVASVVDALKLAQVAVFTTDGMVEQEAIHRFANGVNEHFGHLTLVICVLAGPLPNEEYHCMEEGSDSTSSFKLLGARVPGRLGGVQHPPRSPGLVDSSVFASLSTFQQVLILHLNGGNLRLLQCSDQLVEPLSSQLGIRAPPVDRHNRNTWLSLPQITVPQIKQLRLPLNARQPLPAGYWNLPNGLAIHLDSLLATGVVSGELLGVLNEYMAAVVLLSKNTNRLTRLIRWLGKVEGSRPEWLEAAKAAKMIPHHQFYSSGSVSSCMSSQGR